MGAASYGRSELRAAGAGPAGPQPLAGSGRGGGGQGLAKVTAECRSDMNWRFIPANSFPSSRRVVSIKSMRILSRVTKLWEKRKNPKQTVFLFFFFPVLSLF